MKRYYVQYLSRKLDGRLDWKLGSDGVMYLDGRWGVERAKIEARAHAKRLAAVAPDIEAFEIVAGDRRVAGPFTVA
jgi:hypothetical protein